jgi:hypothetical protein
VILRCTAKALALLGVRPAALPDLRPSEDDWYLNLLWIERNKCLLLTHAGTLFPALTLDVRRADLRPLGSYVVNSSTTSSARKVSHPTRSDTSRPTTSAWQRPRAAACSAS